MKKLFFAAAVLCTMVFLAAEVLASCPEGYDATQENAINCETGEVPQGGIVPEGYAGKFSCSEGCTLPGGVEFSGASKDYPPISCDECKVNNVNIQNAKEIKVENGVIKGRCDAGCDVADGVITSGYFEYDPANKKVSVRRNSVIGRIPEGFEISCSCLQGIYDPQCKERCSNIQTPLGKISGGFTIKGDNTRLTPNSDYTDNNGITLSSNKQLIISPRCTASEEKNCISILDNTLHALNGEWLNIKFPDTETAKKSTVLLENPGGFNEISDSENTLLCAISCSVKGIAAPDLNVIVSIHDRVEGYTRDNGIFICEDIAQCKQLSDSDWGDSLSQILPETKLPEKLEDRNRLFENAQTLFGETFNDLFGFAGNVFLLPADIITGLKE